MVNDTSKSEKEKESISKKMNEKASNLGQPADSNDKLIADGASEKNEQKKKKRKKKEDKNSSNSLSESAADNVDENAPSLSKGKSSSSDGKSTGIDTRESDRKKRKKEKKKNAAESGDAKEISSEEKTTEVSEDKVNIDASSLGEPADSQDKLIADGASENKKKKKRKKMEEDNSLSESPADNADENAPSLSKGKSSSYDDKSTGNDTKESDKKKRKKEKKNTAESGDAKEISSEEKTPEVSEDKVNINATGKSVKNGKMKQENKAGGNLEPSLEIATKSKANGVNGVTSGSDKNKSQKVSFSDNVEVFPSNEDPDVRAKMRKDKDYTDADGLVRGKRFTPEEDNLVKDAVYKFIEVNQLGEEGLKMVLNCARYPQLRGCWREIGTVIPYRPEAAVYYRAHTIFERSETRGFTKEDNEMIRKFYAEYGPQWKKLADVTGKERKHIKDNWRRIRLNVKKGRWSQDEYQRLFDLVNLDLQMKAFDGRKTNHVMLRENISWEAISDKLSTRTMATCCTKWYYQLSSPLVQEGLWSDTDDYKLLAALQNQDACSVEDVEWDSLLEKRSGEICRRRWEEMVRHIGGHRERSFLEQVEVLSTRYSEDMLQYRIAKHGPVKDDGEKASSG